MRLFVFVLLLLVAGVVGFGFYRGWFSFKASHDPETGRDEIKFEIDRKKIEPDIDKIKQKIGGGSAQSGEKPEGP
jgi:hypothetical protein